MLLAVLSVLGPASSALGQTDATSEPRYFSMFTPAYRRARLPPDIGAIVRGLRATDDFEDADGSALDRSDTRFHFSRFHSPERIRSFLVLTISGLTLCGSSGCWSHLYERVGNRWIERTSLVGHDFWVLPYWIDDYPAILTSTLPRTLSLHWWELGEYRWMCFPVSACENG